MILRNGIRSNLRAKGRTALFGLLIFVLTVALALGLGLQAYCGQMLARCDETYTSVAVIEYMGADYPSADAADNAARAAAALLDDEAIRAVPGVQSWQRPQRTLALAEGYSRKSGYVPYQSRGVLLCSSFTPRYEKRWCAVPPEELSPRRRVTDETGAETYYGLSERPITLPAYQYSLADSAWRTWRADGSGGFTAEFVAEADLPAQYVFYDERSGSFGRVYPGPENLDPLSLAQYQYDSATGEYTAYADALVGYTCLLEKSLYSMHRRENVYIYLYDEDGHFTPEPGKKYLLHGSFIQSNTGNSAFAVGPFDSAPDSPFIAEVSGPGDPLLTAGIFAETAAAYDRTNNYIRLEASDDLPAVEEFQQGTLFLEQGRFPAPGETGACVISGKLASQGGFSLGDPLTLSLLSSHASDRFAVRETQHKRSLTVVGITNATAEYDGCVWVSAAEGGFSQPEFGYLLGRVLLDNAKGRDAAAVIQAMLPPQVRLTLYDQGYAAAAQPLRAMQTAAVSLTLAGTAGALAALVLFAFLFVGRQQETVDLLSSLGTPKRKIALWLLSGAAVIASVPAAAGAAVGGALLQTVIRTALAAAQALYSADLRYSEAVIGTGQAMNYTAAPLWWPALVAGAAVLAAALALCGLFLRQARRKTAPKKGSVTVRVPKGGTSTAGRGALRFAMLSLRRGGLRSAAVPAVSLVLTLFLGVLGSVASGWQAQLDSLYASAALQGQLMDISGRSHSGLAVAPKIARALWDSRLLAGMAVSASFPYWADEDVPPFSDNEFGQENRANWVARQPHIVALNDLSAAPEFFYSSPQVTYLPGWDESFLAAEYVSSAEQNFAGGEFASFPALVSRQYLRQKGLAPGDTLSLSYRFYLGSQALYLPVQIKVVGTFQQQGSKANVYVPLGFCFSPEWLFGETNFINTAAAPRMLNTPDSVRQYLCAKTTFGSCRFTLASARQLEALRAYLAKHEFSAVGNMDRSRVTVLLRDGSFVETLGGLQRCVAFGQAVLPALLGAVCVLGFIVSWLMVNGRRMEFAILRGLGAPRGRVFFSFFWEQALLCLAGCLAAAMLLAAFGAPRGLAAAPVFFVCYLAGCSLAVLAVGRTNLMDLLGERE